MYDTKTRVRFAYKRAFEQKKRKQNGLIIKLTIFCCVMFALDMIAIVILSVPLSYTAPKNSLYSTSLLPSSVGGYVLLAVITFVLAVMATVFYAKNIKKIN